MSNSTAESTSSLPKYARVAASIRAQIADGTLRPGVSAPSGAALARITGYSTLTCRKAVTALIKDGVLVPGPTRNARPRVAGLAGAPAEQARTDAARALTAALSTHRRAAGLTQVELAAAAGASVTTIGHAETGRLWQSRKFWERADKTLCADGELLLRHDTYRAALVSLDAPPVAESTASTAPAGQTVTLITITWGDGTVTTVHPPDFVPPAHQGDQQGYALTLWGRPETANYVRERPERLA